MPMAIQNIYHAVGAEVRVAGRVHPYQRGAQGDRGRHDRRHRFGMQRLPATGPSKRRENHRRKAADDDDEVAGKAEPTELEKSAPCNRCRDCCRLACPDLHSMPLG